MVDAERARGSKKGKQDEREEKEGNQREWCARRKKREFVCVRLCVWEREKERDKIRKSREKDWKCEGKRASDIGRKEKVRLKMITR